ncbi:uroporphyrinogen-III C-methyltransferase [Ferrimonas pelagia]|uniref:uroporphyrinogen-III C-methyltransferase n=1 Tax=Ferrimonas pelagia TaxID=1177826 RepID=A0ABP9F4Z0_9GAMM
MDRDGLTTAAKDGAPSGQTPRVSLVGAGPGDPDLLTVKALRCIEQADVILYDNLVSDAIRALFPKSTTTLFVGKAKNCHSIGQDRLNEVIVELAQKGLHVCRLKGGDPFIFGRGSEEMLRLHQAGIQTEVVPGITAASGCTSYAGIPLTHRGLAQACTFVTGHAQSGDAGPDIDWQGLARGNQTLVFYMGLSQLPKITTELAAQGMPLDTPAALIEQGCRPEQRVIASQLSQLVQDSQIHQLQSPTLIVIGEVVSLADQLAWFGPLTQSSMPQALSA